MNYIMIALQLAALWNEINWLFSWADLLFARKKSVEVGTRVWKLCDRKGRLLFLIPAAAVFFLVAAVLCRLVIAVAFDQTLARERVLGAGIFLVAALFVTGGFLVAAFWESKAAKAFLTAGMYCLALVVFWLVLLFVTASIYAHQNGQVIINNHSFPKWYWLKTAFFGWGYEAIADIASLMLTLLSLPGRLFLWTALNWSAQKRYRKHAEYPAPGLFGRFSTAICTAGYVGSSCLVFHFVENIQDLAMNWPWLINELVIVALVLIFYAIFRYLTSRRDMRMIRAQNDLLMANYERISEIYTENAKFYHDMKHHLNMLSFLHEQNRADEAAAYLQSLDVGSLMPLPKTYTGVETVDVILAETKRRADQRGIRLTLETCPLPMDMAVEKKDLTALLFNLTDNALAAARQEICIRIRTEGRMLVLYMENDCGGQVDSVAARVETGVRNRGSGGRDHVAEPAAVRTETRARVSGSSAGDYMMEPAAARVDSDVESPETGATDLTAGQTAAQTEEKAFQKRRSRTGHGWGLKSVRSVVEKYHGDIRCEKKNGRYCVELYMNV